MAVSRVLRQNLRKLECRAPLWRPDEPALAPPRLIRYAPGDAPTYKHESFANWRDGKWGTVLTQDFTNFEQVQAGMHTDGFTGLRINPLQETAIANYHQMLRKYLFDAA